MELQPYRGADLLRFVTQDMVMSSYYQPLVIRSLIRAPSHRMAAADLARQLLLQDSFAVGKALDTLNRWPKITLRRRGIAYYDRAAREYVLPVVFDTDDQRDQVLAACTAAITGWHKKVAPRVASRFYQLIVDAGGRCQACGVLARVRPLDIDHIIPRAKARKGKVTLPGGTPVPVDDLRNLQVLCTLCNRGKRDTSSYDFRPSAERFAETINQVLQLAKSAGHNPQAVLEAALSANGLDIESRS